MQKYDVIVIGAGGVGSAALYHLARRGVRVLALDRFEPGHDRGSSHGQTRIIRLAYYEHPDYVPLLKRSYDLWHSLAQESNKRLFHEVGLLSGGPTQGEIVAGTLQSATQHGLPLEQLSPAEVSHRWPGLRLPENFQGLFEKRAGYLLVEDCVKTHVELAVGAGAQIRCDIQVQGWRVEGNSVIVETDKETFAADRLVITAGAWAAAMLASLPVTFTVLRKPLFWYATQHPAYEEQNGCPCFFFDSPTGMFYGFPQTTSLGVKVAEHTGGRTVEDPLNVDRSLDTSEQSRIEAFLGNHLPAVTRECTAHKVCLYTMSPDSHFVVDRHPEHPQVVYTAGLSGHGFKFTSVLGEIMSQLALDGKTPHGIDFLSLRRFKS